MWTRCAEETQALVHDHGMGLSLARRHGDQQKASAGIHWILDRNDVEVRQGSDQRCDSLLHPRCLYIRQRDCGGGSPAGLAIVGYADHDEPASRVGEGGDVARQVPLLSVGAAVKLGPEV